VAKNAMKSAENWSINPLFSPKNFLSHKIKN
jgi:hypothetical protein